MDFLEKLCLEMARNPDILTFSDIAKAAANGAVAGHKTKLPGGVLSGAVLGISLEASDRALKISKKLLHTQQFKFGS